MDRSSADELLTGNPLVPCIEGAVAYAKELERSLLDAEIPALLAKPPTKACCGSGGCGCSAKVQVMVREADLPRVAALFRDEWMQAVQREGTIEFEKDGQGQEERKEEPRGRVWQGEIEEDGRDHGGSPEWQVLSTEY